MRNILHHTTKYDGGLHYRFPAQVVEEHENTLVIYRGPGPEIESYRGTMTATRRMLAFFYNHRHYNTIIMWEGDWEPRAHYVNIATPAVWDDKRITAIDLDLDLILLAEDDRLFIDDEDEFEVHKEKYGYPEDLVATCRTELDRIHSAMAVREGVFSREIFDWRPGESIPEALVEAI